MVLMACVVAYITWSATVVPIHNGMLPCALCVGSVSQLTCLIVKHNLNFKNYALLQMLSGIWILNNKCDGITIENLWLWHGLDHHMPCFRIWNKPVRFRNAKTPILCCCPYNAYMSCPCDENQEVMMKHVENHKSFWVDNYFIATILTLVTDFWQIYQKLFYDLSFYLIWYGV
jgi:hypothetical protein